jgi:hypothetical protein
MQILEEKIVERGQLTKEMYVCALDYTRLLRQPTPSARRPWLDLCTLQSEQSEGIGQRLELQALLATHQADCTLINQPLDKTLDTTGAPKATRVVLNTLSWSVG